MMIYIYIKRTGDFWLFGKFRGHVDKRGIRNWTDRGHVENRGIGKWTDIA